MSDKLSWAQLTLLTALKSGGVMIFMYDGTRGLYRLTKDGTTRSQHPATVNSLWPVGCSCSDDGAVTVAPPPKRPELGRPPRLQARALFQGWPVSMRRLHHAR
jgi:hypothetical protein